MIQKQTRDGGPGRGATTGSGPRSEGARRDPFSQISVFGKLGIILCAQAAEKRGYISRLSDGELLEAVGLMTRGILDRSPELNNGDLLIQLIRAARERPELLREVGQVIPGAERGDCYSDFSRDAGQNDEYERAGARGKLGIIASSIPRDKEAYLRRTPDVQLAEMIGIAIWDVANGNGKGNDRYVFGAIVSEVRERDDIMYGAKPLIEAHR